MSNRSEIHTPIMVEQVIGALSPHRAGTYVDGTVGCGGHSLAILEAAGPSGRLIGLDRDPESLEVAAERLSAFRDRVTLVHEDFANLPEVLTGEGIHKVDGILLDLGFSSYQLSRPERGFAFSLDGPVDMRLDRTAGKTAMQVIKESGEQELKGILTDLGEERWAKRIARAIVRARHNEEIRTTRDLADVITSAIPASRRPKHHHPATKSFMALRMTVNQEMDSLRRFMDSAADLLVEGGRLCVISFQSMEDRIVKNRLRDLEKPCTCPVDLPVCGCGRTRKMRVLNRRPVCPDRTETTANPRARSARLRAAERTAGREE
ncbi:16S rRNA (cytosine(1402)-N(4))-methyltransferase RsmH [Thermodesulfobacteriota bacterium]